jgi:nitrite reductase (NADH) small subunit
VGFVKVANVNDVEEGRGKVVEANNRVIALFKKNGSFYALDNSCKHEGGPLGEGELEGDMVVCPWHQWKYSIKTGNNTAMPNIKIDTFKVKIEGDSVLIEIPD